MRLISLQVGKPELRASTIADGKDVQWTSAIFKAPVSGPRRLSPTQLDGDAQADLKNHGGVDKAVNCYCVEHYPAWRRALDLTDDQFGFGAFGENFTVSEMTEENVCVGDIYQIGTARVQISQPRQPCWKLGRKWENAALPLNVIESGQTGYYLRVLEPGIVQAGDALTLLARPEPGWTIARLNDAFYNRKDDREIAQVLAGLPTLAEAWRGVFRRLDS